MQKYHVHYISDNGCIIALQDVPQIIGISRDFMKNTELYAQYIINGYTRVLDEAPKILEVLWA